MTQAHTACEPRRANRVQLGRLGAGGHERADDGGDRDGDGHRRRGPDARQPLEAADLLQRPAHHPERQDEDQRGGDQRHPVHAAVAPVGRGAHQPAGEDHDRGPGTVRTPVQRLGGQVADGADDDPVPADLRAAQQDRGQLGAAGAQRVAGHDDGGEAGPRADPAHHGHVGTEDERAGEDDEHEVVEGERRPQRGAGQHRRGEHGEAEQHDRDREERLPRVRRDRRDRVVRVDDLRRRGLGRGHDSSPMSSSHSSGRSTSIRSMRARQSGSSSTSTCTPRDRSSSSETWKLRFSPTTTRGMS